MSLQFFSSRKIRYSDNIAFTGCGCVMVEWTLFHAPRWVTYSGQLGLTKCQKTLMAPTQWEPLRSGWDITKGKLYFLIKKELKDSSWTLFLMKFIQVVLHWPEGPGENCGWEPWWPVPWPGSRRDSRTSCSVQRQSLASVPRFQLVHAKRGNWKICLRRGVLTISHKTFLCFNIVYCPGIFYVRSQKKNPMLNFCLWVWTPS